MITRENPLGNRGITIMPIVHSCLPGKIPVYNQILPTFTHRLSHIRRNDLVHLLLSLLPFNYRLIHNNSSTLALRPA
jgi:hypothetical protein